MMTPAQAILWQLWRRHRWVLLAECVYLLAAIAAVHLLPDAVLRTSMGDSALPLVGRFVGLSCPLIAIHFVGIFSFVGEGSKDSEFPPRLFVLPVRTSMLVALPMLCGCLASTFHRLIVATQILRPAGIATPLAWPAALGW